MPIVKKGEKRGHGAGQQTAPETKRRKTTKVFHQFSSVGYREDHFHTIFRSIPDRLDDLQKLLCKFIGSFLNGDGGILCFGARPNGTVYGERINRKEEDHLKLTIDIVMKKFGPLVKTDAYRVSFIPVEGGETHCCVIEIRIKPGGRFEMYEDMNHEVYIRKGEVAYGPLSPHEIKDITIRQLQQKLKIKSTIQMLERAPTPKIQSVVCKKEIKENRPIPKKSETENPEGKKLGTKVDVSQKTASASTATTCPVDSKKALKQATNTRYKLRRPLPQTSEACPPPPTAHCSHPQSVHGPHASTICQPPRALTVCPPPPPRAPTVCQPPPPRAPTVCQPPPPRAPTVWRPPPPRAPTVWRPPPPRAPTVCQPPPPRAPTVCRPLPPRAPTVYRPPPPCPPAVFLPPAHYSYNYHHFTRQCYQ